MARLEELVQPGRYSMKYSMVTTVCPHCDMLVRFSYSEICPSCNINGNDPVTQQDFERIEKIKTNDFLRNNYSKTEDSTLSSKRAIYIFYGALFATIKLLMFVAYHAR